jgi:DNA-binding transcriptional ArsR family regulator/uncharacterized protein YndB with AHSA1/START domain
VIVDVALEALGDRTRREIVGRLAASPASVGELAETLPVGRPAVSMHLRVLREAGLVRARAEGTRRLYQVQPEALAAMRDYLDWYWTRALASFKQHVEIESEESMPPELKVTKSVVVDAEPARAFEVFLDQQHWWPLGTHHMADSPAETVVLEPFIGGRWYERAGDGSETEWGRVLAFEPPHRILLSWRMSTDWGHEADPSGGSEIEVTFLAEGQNHTRVVFEHRHLERYGDDAQRMQAGLDRPNAAEAVVRAFRVGVTTTKTQATRRQRRRDSHDQ